MTKYRSSLIFILLLYMFDFTCLADVMFLAVIVNFILESEK